MSDTRNTFGRESITRKSKKLPVRLDLTALVSISFLLIMFFMLSSYMSRPQAMDLGMPDKIQFDDFSSGCCECSDDRTLTLLIGKESIVSYYGYLNFPYEEPKNLTFNPKSLRKELLEKSKLVISRYNNDYRKGLIVIIKPSKDSNYESLVNVLDEMTITDVKTYAIIEISPEENNFLNKFN